MERFHSSTSNLEDADNLHDLGDQVNEDIPYCQVCLSSMTQGLLFECLHTVCKPCTQKNQPVECPSCGTVTCVSITLTPDFQHSNQKNQLLPKTKVTDEHLKQIHELDSLTKKARQRIKKLPSYVTKISNRLGELQEQRDNVKSLIEETHQNYKRILETCKNEALDNLNQLHKQRELEIMERLENLDVIKGSMEYVCNYSKKLTEDCSCENIVQLQPFVQSQINRLIKRLDDTLDSTLCGALLRWSSDPVKFTKSIKNLFGLFSTSSEDSTEDHILNQKQTISSTNVINTQEETLTKLTKEESALDRSTTSHSDEEILYKVSVEAPPVYTKNTSQETIGTVSQTLNSPTNTLYHPSLVSSPSLLMKHQRFPSCSSIHDISPIQPSELDDPGNVSAQHNAKQFTLADLISDIAEDGYDQNWDESGGKHALSNLTALATLDVQQDTWSHLDWSNKSNLLMVDMDKTNNRTLSIQMDSKPVFPGVPCRSPMMDSLVVPGVSVRGTSPVSPSDTMMPEVGMPLSPLSPLPPPLLHTAAQPRPALETGNQPVLPQLRSVNIKLNTMQIRCKFGKLGPCKGYFNSPHGFCLGLEEEIIVADTNNHRIQVFEKNGTYQYQFGIPGKEEGQLWYPRKVAVLKNSGKFVVCDRGNERSRMQIFTKHGHFVRKIAIRYIDIVAGLAISRDDHIVAVDSVTPTMFVISEQGDLLRWFDCADHMREPSDIAVGGAEFYICDFKGHNVVVFTEDGLFLRRIGYENITNFPNGIDISDAGDILIGDSHGNRFHVAVFSSKGTLLSEFECPHVKVSRCCGLKITSEGFVVTLAKNNHHVLVLNTLYIS